ncbi:MAG: hypothetical protein AAFY45_34470, partial [Bacteroidota bacterium]
SLMMSSFWPKMLIIRLREAFGYFLAIDRASNKPLKGLKCLSSIIAIALNRTFNKEQIQPMSLSKIQIT